jgi:hypothetical protein
MSTPAVRVLRVPALLLVAVLLPLSLSAQGPAFAGSDRGLTVTSLPEILEEPEVREHLTSGLTTTFVFRVAAGGSRRSRGGRTGWIALRYDLWDEAFHLAVGGDFASQSTQFASYEELAGWWERPQPPLVLADFAGAAGSGPFLLELDLIPFSRAEQRDTQRWLADSLSGAGRGSAESVADATEDGPEVATSVFNLLIATSVRRDSLYHRTWTVEVSRGEDPPR